MGRFLPCAIDAGALALWPVAAVTLMIDWGIVLFAVAAFLKARSPQ